MVAYGFKPFFAPQIRNGNKRQTIRGHRRRHARPGEPVQLYTGMRTRRCEKIIPDPVCTSVGDVRIDLRALEGVFVPPNTNADVLPLLHDIELVVNGIRLTGFTRHWFAADDGFGDLWRFGDSKEVMSPWVAMVFFWMREHGPVLFDGVIIQWGTAS